MLLIIYTNYYFDMKVELLGFYGGDKSHALSAWTSTSRDYESKKDRIPQLLAKLASEGHHTPFEKSSLHFLVSVEQASHIHLLKHRIGVSINGESARYKELKEDKYYLPEDWKDIKVKDSVTFGEEWVDIRNKDWVDVLKDYADLGNTLYHNALKDLTPILGRKRAKESARFFKTINSELTLDVMFNFRSFVHFLELRHKEEAQLEIYNIAGEMLELVRGIPDFEHSLKAFGL
jgi:flavin-dependent thymidylate synthase